MTMTLENFIKQKQAELEQFQQLCERKLQRGAANIERSEDEFEELFMRYDFGLLA